MERLKREMQTLERDIKKAKNGKSVAEEKEGVPEAIESLRQAGIKVWDYRVYWVSLWVVDVIALILSMLIGGMENYEMDHFLTTFLILSKLYIKSTGLLENSK